MESFTQITLKKISLLLSMETTQLLLAFCERDLSQRSRPETRLFIKHTVSHRSGNETSILVSPFCRWFLTDLAEAGNATCLERISQWAMKKYLNQVLPDEH